MKLFTSFKPDSVEAHRSSVSKSQEIYSGNADVSDEDFCAAIAQRLQLRNMNDDSNENLSHRAWSDICDDPALLSRVSLCLRPVPVQMHCMECQ